MSPARLTATAVDRSLKLIRWPVNLAIGRRSDTRAGADARIAVDRFDASAGGRPAAVLRDYVDV